MWHTYGDISVMKVIESKYEILTDLSNPIQLLRQIENAGRICYKSEDKITDTSCLTFCQMLINRGHEAMLEHSSLTVKFTIDRAIANELVRHRIASYAQSSTRYCNYSKGKFGNEIKVIKPEAFETGTYEFDVWWSACKNAEDSYMALIKNGTKPELARNVLPLSLATEIVCTANIREWRNIFKLRTTIFAHPQMRSIMNKLLYELNAKIPVLFSGIQPYNEASDA